MARNFIDQEIGGDKGLTFRDGLRFGFGFFFANLLGLTVLGALALAVNYITHLH